MEIAIRTSCMPSERFGNTLWPENDRAQVFEKHIVFEKFEKWLVETKISLPESNIILQQATIDSERAKNYLATRDTE